MRLTAMILYLVSLATPALADTMITCGPSDGYAYYLPQGQLSAKDAGWTPDTLSKGALALVKNGNRLDILFKDDRGMSSSAADGGVVTMLGSSHVHGNIVVTVSYPGKSFEVYTFDMIGKTVLWSQHKYGAAINKAATYRSKCK